MATGGQGQGQGQGRAVPAPGHHGGSENWWNFKVVGRPLKGEKMWNFIGHPLFSFFFGCVGNNIMLQMVSLNLLDFVYRE